MTKEQNDLLSEFNRDQSVYLVFTHVVGTKEDGEAYDKKYPRYITLSEEKAKSYMQANAKHIKFLSQEHKDIYFIHKITDSEIVYSTHYKETTNIITIFLGEYYLDCAFSEF